MFANRPLHNSSAQPAAANLLLACRQLPTLSKTGGKGAGKDGTHKPSPVCCITKQAHKILTIFHIFKSELRQDAQGQLLIWLLELNKS